MEIGDYLRTKSGIHKIFRINYNATVWKYHCDKKPTGEWDSSYEYIRVCDYDVIGSSKDLIDLIEVGDYVNGYKVSFVGKESVMGEFVQCDYEVSFGTTNHYRFYKVDIKSIVTKEQFESMEYKVGE